MSIFKITVHGISWGTDIIIILCFNFTGMISSTFFFFFLEQFLGFLFCFFALLGFYKAPWLHFTDLLHFTELTDVYIIYL